MNCLYEAVAEAYLRLRCRFVPEPSDELGDAEESLLECRASLRAKEADLSQHCLALGREALAKRRDGDPAGARFHLQARPRAPRPTPPRALTPRPRRSAAATRSGSTSCATASPWSTSSSTPSAPASSTRS